MAGKRRKSGKPTLRVARPERRRQTLNERLAATADPLTRLAAAVDYYRSAYRTNQQPQSAERMVEALVGEGDRLYATSRGDAR
ncbi:hypothetical protein [Thermomonospora umbrina]|uniref:Uncharacterized protein n=1 Tax=Thermomonospora umbrina TaxID=111806 RepID=A0A3D9T9A5_9ACTN|nr:hypothetical protein [Thermomonospora umbrina]REF00342.1 hypothetical protein DFJ69_5874 [Thermomonospora umbrina]